MLIHSACYAGELKQSIDEALEEPQQQQQSVQSRIQQLLKDNPVMLFMKGVYSCHLVGVGHVREVMSITAGGLPS